MSNFWLIDRFNRVNGTSPIITIVITAGAASARRSSEANSNPLTANVSKLNGRNIKVAGNSFKLSRKTSVNEVINEGYKIGN